MLFNGYEQLLLSIQKHCRESLESHRTSAVQRWAMNTWWVTVFVGNPLLHLLSPLNLGRNFQQSQLDWHSIPFRKRAFKKPLITITCMKGLHMFLFFFLNKIMVPFPTEWYYSSISRNMCTKQKALQFHFITFISFKMPAPILPLMRLLLPQWFQNSCYFYDSRLSSSSMMPLSLNIQDGRNPLTSVGTASFLPSSTMLGCLHPLWLPPPSKKPDSVFPLWCEIASKLCNSRLFPCAMVPHSLHHLQWQNSLLFDTRLSPSFAVSESIYFQNY